MQLIACPDRQTLNRILDGQGSADENQALEQHLEFCEPCKSELSDTFSGLQLDTQCAPPMPPQDRNKSLTSHLKSLWGTVPPQSRRAEESLDLSVRFAPLLPGEIGLGRLGHYVVKRLLGQGGMGCVLLAEDTRLSREVAIKIMNSLPANNLKQKNRFLREAQDVAAIHNDHVVEIHHVDEDQGTPYFVMPLLHGETLQSRLRREKFLPYADVLRIGREVALGLAAAHGGKRKLIHRDVKPANIWLEAGNDRVKLLDFGLALDPNTDLTLTNSDALRGTAPYMSPEQARCESEIDERTDLFSLGSVLYEMSTGQMAFDRRGLMNTLNAVIGEQPTPPDQLVPDLPAEFCHLVQRLLSKDRGSRPTSATAVATELKDLQHASQRDAVYATVAVKPERKRVANKPIAKSSSAYSVLLGRPVLTATAAALLSVVFLAVIVINLNGKEELVIETDPSYEVTILEDKQVLLKDITQNTSLRVRPGKHEFEVLLKDSTGKEAQSFVTTNFKIVRGGKRVLNIRQEAAKAGVKSQQVIGKPDPSSEKDRLAAKWLLAQPGVRLQGHLNGKGILLDSGQSVPENGDFTIHDLNLPAALVLSKDAVHLEDLQHLAAVSIIGAEFDDSGLLKLCQRLSRCPRMILLQLSGTAVSDQGLKHLESIPSLQSVALNETRITNEGLHSLVQMKHLQAIEVSATEITEDGLAVLAQQMPLKALAIGGFRLTDRGLEHLDQLPNMEKLSVWATEISDAGVIRLIEKHPRLDRLDLGSTQVTDAIIPSLLSLQNLNQLVLNMTLISGQGYETLKRSLPNAEILWREPNDTVANQVLSIGGEVTLRVSGAENDQVLKEPAQVPKDLFRLLKLKIDGKEPQVARFQYDFSSAMGTLFGGYPSNGLPFQDLTALEFSGPWFTDGTMQQLRPNDHPQIVRAWAMRPDLPSAMSWLQELSLANAGITDDSLERIAYFKQLHKLNLAGTAIRGSGLKHLTSLEELKELNLACPMLTEVFLATLAELPKLEVLSLANSGIADGAVATLKQLKHLKQLDLTGTKLSPLVIDQLKTALPDCQVLATP